MYSIFRFDMYSIFRFKNQVLLYHYSLCVVFEYNYFAMMNKLDWFGDICDLQAEKILSPRHAAVNIRPKTFLATGNYLKKCLSKIQILLCDELQRKMMLVTQILFSVFFWKKDANNCGLYKNNGFECGGDNFEFSSEDRFWLLSVW